MKVNNIIEYFSGLNRALMKLFPEIGLDETKFPDFRGIQKEKKKKKRKITKSKKTKQKQNYNNRTNADT